MSAITFRTGWRRNDQVLQQDAKAFWQAHNTLPLNVDPDERAGELCAIAYSDTSVVGVSTATIEFVPQFRSYMAAYRCSVAKGFLTLPPLSWAITDYSRKAMEHWSLENPDAKVMGLYAVLQARALIERYPQVVGPAKMTFAGFTPGGFPIRVAWFKHATIPTEWPPRRLQDPDTPRYEAVFRVALDTRPKPPEGGAS